jgi:hypothetical protein
METEVVACFLVRAKFVSKTEDGILVTNNNLEQQLQAPILDPTEFLSVLRGQVEELRVPAESRLRREMWLV